MTCEPAIEDALFDTNGITLLPLDFIGRFDNISYKSNRKLLHLNCWSLQNETRHVEIDAMLDNLKIAFDALFFTETCYNSLFPFKYYARDTYHPITQNRSYNSHGGIAIYLSDKYKDYSVLEEICFNNEDFECLSVYVQGLVYIVVYRPPSGNIKAFYEQFEKLLLFVKAKKLLFVLISDLNINLFDMGNYNELQNLVNSYGASVSHRQPTRYYETNGVLRSSCIDVCITNMLLGNNFCGVIDYKIRDHLPTFYVLDKPSPKTKSGQTVYFQNIKKSNLRNFASTLDRKN